MRGVTYGHLQAFQPCNGDLRQLHAADMPTSCPGDVAAACAELAKEADPLLELTAGGRSVRVL
jgi:hypothetical protein